jgi:hypothetical protein
MSIKVVIATHKEYDMPDDQMYLPLQVGKVYSSQDLYTGDNTGDNISRKNPNYCELTAMYWAWKNLDADYIGLAHYRRHFCVDRIFLGPTKDKKHKILTNEKAEELLSHYDAILPKKRHYWIETLASHYNHSHYSRDLEATRRIIADFCPAYLPAFDLVMNRRSAHMFNMMIMRKDLFHVYSRWLFNILFRLEKRIDISGYSAYEARVFGFISELLLDVWLTVNSVHYVEMPVMFMEKQNWPRKIFGFLKNKFTTNHEDPADTERIPKQKKAVEAYKFNNMQ